MPAKSSDGTWYRRVRFAEDSRVAGAGQNAGSLFDTANPQPNPQKVMSYTTCVYLGSLHALVSHCKT